MKNNNTLKHEFEIYLERDKKYRQAYSIGLGMKWYNFNIYFRLFISAFFAYGQLMSAVVEERMNIQPLFIGLIIWLLFIRHWMYRFQYKGVINYFIVLYGQPVLLLVYAAISYTAGNQIDPSNIVGYIASIIYFIPDIIYYKKRICLFDKVKLVYNPTSEENTTTPSNTESINNNNNDTNKTRQATADTQNRQNVKYRTTQKMKWRDKMLDISMIPKTVELDKTTLLPKQINRQYGYGRAFNAFVAVDDNASYHRSTCTAVKGIKKNLFHRYIAVTYMCPCADCTPISSIDSWYIDFLKTNFKKFTSYEDFQKSVGLYPDGLPCVRIVPSNEQLSLTDTPAAQLSFIDRECVTGTVSLTHKFEEASAATEEMFAGLETEEKERISKENELKDIEKLLQQLTNSLSQAKHDLGDTSKTDIKNMYKSGIISKSQYDEMINSIEVLEYYIASLPKSIALTETMRNNLLDELKTLK